MRRRKRGRSAPVRRFLLIALLALMALRRAEVSIADMENRPASPSQMIGLDLFAERGVQVRFLGWEWSELASVNGMNELVAGSAAWQTPSRIREGAMEFWDRVAVQLARLGAGSPVNWP